MGQGAHRCQPRERPCRNRQKRRRLRRGQKTRRLRSRYRQWGRGFGEGHPSGLRQEGNPPRLHPPRAGRRVPPDGRAGGPARQGLQLERPRYSSRVAVQDPGSHHDRCSHRSGAGLLTRSGACGSCRLVCRIALPSECWRVLLPKMQPRAVSLGVGQLGLRLLRLTPQFRPVKASCSLQVERNARLGQNRHQNLFERGRVAGAAHRLTGA